MSNKQLKRFGVSMEEGLLQKFDQLIKTKGYENRSEAVRDLVRDALVKQTWEDDEQMVAGSVLIFYDHHQSDLLQELTVIQHEMHDQVLATTHFHIDHSNCLEIIVVKGKAKDIRSFSDQLISLKGVKYGKFTVSPLESME
ncbi:nickel-responsive transcriptional regulator NikR [Alkalihalobacillus oceani]|uniref:nickel-responsive transcriptional regulator NikR n=1 Tax=Halalkalibacter oceani TaxID=1653776 RepID=UPI00203DD89C|nr:nickel-responsive transcriptional regulator NikR [Halalkalibacter oceani]MCM3760835.1 nickel-responsive transcriptional regulator NikR [Halalkalibacter oceani]